MKSFSGAVALLSLAATEVSAHYIFNSLAVDNSKPAHDHVRYNTNYNSPVTSLTSNDLRCNVGGATAGNTTTIAVKAGDAFTFGTDTPVYHQGPISLYMSKAPTTAAEYDGSGGWFKIFDWGPTFQGGQASWPMRSDYTSDIPECVADGEYLLRIQSLAIHNPGSTPQFYISCAQISVTGGGNANPETVLIPGAFKATDPGYTANIYNNFNSYTVPGPEPLKC